MSDDRPNVLYYGDNLDILRRYIGDETVDLVYLDPPFQSGKNYNVLFQEQDGTRAAAQIRAFEDTWRWDQAAAATYEDVVGAGGQVANVLEAFRRILGPSEMLAYLTIMAPRLLALHRTLRPTGSLYLHCDPTASHYLKILLDAIFGVRGFRNEIAWHYTGWNKILKDHFEWRHDILLLYAKDENAFFGLSVPWNSVNEYIRVRRQKVLTDEAGHDYVLSDAGGGKRIRRYIADAIKAGRPADDVWNVDKLNNSSHEKLGYQTQKPEALLERVIKASSTEGDVVLDPFCGCGTTIAVAQRLHRQWIGIDVTHLAIQLVKRRLADAHGPEIAAEYRVVGEPVDLASAETLALANRHQFQHWALGLVHARASDRGKGPDRGIDGVLRFQEGKGVFRDIMISVKSGAVSVRDVRDLVGVVTREKAAIGVLITLQEPTKPMCTEAVEAGFYKDSAEIKHLRIQILTIEDLLNGRTMDCPGARVADGTFKRARFATPRHEQLHLMAAEDGPEARPDDDPDTTG